MFYLITLYKCWAFASNQHSSKASWQKYFSLAWSMNGECRTKSWSVLSLNRSFIELRTSLPLRLRIAIISLWIKLRFKVCFSTTTRHSVNEGMLIHSSSQSIVSWLNRAQPVTISPYITFLQQGFELDLSSQSLWLYIRSWKSTNVCEGVQAPLKHDAAHTFLNSRQRLLNCCVLIVELKLSLLPP